MGQKSKAKNFQCKAETICTVSLRLARFGIWLWQNGIHELFCEQSRACLRSEGFMANTGSQSFCACAQMWDATLPHATAPFAAVVYCSIAAGL